MKKLTSEKIQDFVSKPLFDERVILNKDSSWPKISIVTPSFNQAEFLERTILSVLNQNYPNLEYIIIDGGSTDGSVEIIKKYERYLTFWVSEKDEGQADAINKGFKKSNGEILGWINSDDTYERNALYAIAMCFLHNPDVSFVYGDAKIIDSDDNVIYEHKSVPANTRSLIYDGCNLNQASAFWKRDAFFDCGMLNKNLVCAMEYELFYKIFSTKKVKHIRRVIANLRIHPLTKSIQLLNVLAKERTEIIKSHIPGYPANKRLWKIIYALRRYYFYIIQGDIYHLFIRLPKKLGIK